MHEMSLNSQKPESESDAAGRRLCDFCGDATALVYCRADSAKLCLACDRQVHSTNPLFTKHTRWLLCDACDSTPATIFCSTHGSVFCQNCDWETHMTNRSLPAVHERRPLEGFCGCPSVSDLLGILGFEEIGKKALLFGDDVADTGSADVEEINGRTNLVDVNDAENFDGLSNLLVWETPSVVTLDDLIMANDSSSGCSLQAMGVPPLPKNRNATCGQYKEEVLFQLRQMSKLEANITDVQSDAEPLTGFQSLVREENLRFGQQDQCLNYDAEPMFGSSYDQGSAFQWSSDKVEDADQDFSTLFGGCIEMNQIDLDKDSGISDNAGPINVSHEELSPRPGAETFQIPRRLSIRELNSQGRDSAITRYMEKKKTRRYDKRIRYETRKVRAESRTRIKGRFAKMDR